MAERRIRVIVFGEVQGVAFRASALRMAEGLGLHGWVRNLADGRVEALFEGATEDVEKALAWCRHGPAFARVTGATAHEEAAAGDLAGFTIRPTAR